MELRNFYKFVTIDAENIPILKEKLLEKGNSLGIKGTIILAEEGINAATTAHSAAHNLAFQSFIEACIHTRFEPLISRLTEISPEETELPFKKFKVKIRKEIVSLGVDGLDPTCVTGEFVSPQDWNTLISDPQTITIDTRNAYEFYMGHFKHAINPDTNTFREFIAYIKSLDAHQYKHIAMYCTGGIRCEKATSFIKELGIQHSYQLKGGILSYFQQVPAEENLWEGECFVFDDRIAVDIHMKPSIITHDTLNQDLHKEKTRSPHTGYIYKKIMSLVR